MESTKIKAVVTPTGSRGAWSGPKMKMISLPLKARKTTSRPLKVVCLRGVSESGDIIEFEKGRLIGKGTNTSIFEAITSNGVLAVKQVPLGTRELFLMRWEIDALKRVPDNENVIKWKGMAKDKRYMFMLMEKGEQTLMEMYGKTKLSHSDIRAIARQLVHGLAYIHGRGVEHRDLTSNNVLVMESGSIKIADFGLSALTKVEGNPDLGKDDVWYLGSMILELYKRGPPFTHHMEAIEIHNNPKMKLQFIGDEDAVASWPTVSDQEEISGLLLLI